MAFLLLAYGYEAYVLERHNFIGLLGIYTAIWVFTLGMLIQCSHKYLLAFAFAVRFLLILAIPNLSQDFYRFIWDGKLLALGYNPYLYLPIEVIKDPSFLISNGVELYQGMGALSAGHYTNYPPLNQLCFWLAALLGNGSIMQSVVVLRLIIIAADYGIYVYGSKILQKMSLPGHNIYWYLLNPLVIIELTGNLHFEGVMMFCFILSLFWLTYERLGRSALGFSASVLIKLVPLMFAPFIANHLRLHKAAKFAAIAFLVLILGFLPFLNINFVQHYQATVGLWFVNFEFNASIYYLVRYWGFMHYGYNIIGTYGQVLPFVIIAIMGYFSFLNFHFVQLF